MSVAGKIAFGILGMCGVIGALLHKSLASYAAFAVYIVAFIVACAIALRDKWDHDDRKQIPKDGNAD